MDCHGAFFINLYRVICRGDMYGILLWQLFVIVSFASFRAGAASVAYGFKVALAAAFVTRCLLVGAVLTRVRFPAAQAFSLGDQALVCAWRSVFLAAIRLGSLRPAGLACLVLAKLLACDLVSLGRLRLARVAVRRADCVLLCYEVLYLHQRRTLEF